MKNTIIDGALRLYLESLIVNTQGDMAATGRSYTSWTQSLNDFYSARWTGDFDQQYDVPATWLFDDLEEAISVDVK